MWLPAAFISIFSVTFASSPYPTPCMVLLQLPPYKNLSSLCFPHFFFVAPVSYFSPLQGPSPHPPIQHSAYVPQGTIWKREWKDCKSQRGEAVSLKERIFSIWQGSQIHEISIVWLPKQDLRNNANWHPNMNGEKPYKTPPLEKERAIMVAERGRLKFPWVEFSYSYPLPSSPS